MAGLGWYPRSRMKHNLINCDIKLVSYSLTTTMMHGPIYLTRLYLCVINQVPSDTKIKSRVFATLNLAHLFQLLHVIIQHIPITSHYTSTHSNYFTLYFNTFQLLHIILQHIPMTSHYTSTHSSYFILYFSTFQLLHIILQHIPITSHYNSTHSNYFILYFSTYQLFHIIPQHFPRSI